MRSVVSSRRPLIAGMVLALVAGSLPLASVSANHIDLTFTTQPGNGTGGSPLSPQPVVHASNNGPVAGLPVTLEIRAADNDAGGVLSCSGGNTVVTNGAGDAVFTGCEIDRAQNNYRLRATAPHASGRSSAAGGFDVSVGPPHHLVFSQYPADPTPSPLAPQPAVRIVDEGGNTATADTRTISLSINQNAGTFGCTGGLSKAAVGGVASFTGCQQTTSGPGYTLTATTTGLADNDVTGPAFTVNAGGTRLLLCWGSTSAACNATPPTNSTGGVPFSTQPHVRVVNAANQTVKADDATIVTLAKTPNTPTAGGPGTLTCTGGLTRTVTDGIAPFSGCAIDRAGTGYRLRATSNPALTQADSNAFNVAVGPAAKLGFTSQPTAGTAGQPLPDVVVAVQDAGGNTVTRGQSAAITLLVTPPNPSGAVLACTSGTTVAVVNGVATFRGCTISRAGTFTLNATPGGVVPPGNIAPATSAPIVLAAAAAQISLFASSSVITWGSSVVLNVQFGANGANRQVVFQSSTDGVNWLSSAAPLTATTNAAGHAAIAYRPARNLSYRALFAGAPDLAAASSNVVRVVVRQIALLRPTNHGQIRFVEGGRPEATVLFTTTVRPARPELPRATVRYVVYKLIGRSWLLDQTQDVLIDQNGIARFQVTFDEPTRWYVRSVALPTSSNANSVWSQLERYAAGFPGLDV